MPKSSEPKSQSLVQPLTETAAATVQNDERLFDNTLSEGDSFETLKKVSGGGAHFQFKSEKSWTLTDPPENSRFQVRISPMSQNFLNIAFRDRWNLYSESYFKQNNVDSPENCIQGDNYISMKTIDLFLEDGFLKPVIEDDRQIYSISKKLDKLDAEWTEFSKSFSIAEHENISTASATTSTKKSIEDIAVSKLSNLNLNQETFVQKSEATDSNKHNLEDWLDSILDD